MKRFSFFLLLAIPAIILTAERGSGTVYAQEDENIDDIVDVEGEDNTVITDDEPEEETTNASSDADTTILFTKPVHNALSTLELPAGNLVEFLVGFTNNGENDFVLESLDASFRYAMDFNFYIQNFSTFTFNKVVKPKHEATLAYSFIPSETFAGRPFGLNVNLNYKDTNGIGYSEAVYNETIQVIELDDGLDGETVFLYVFLAACVILTLVGGQQLLSSFGRKSRSSTTRKAPIEMGTSNPNNVDYDWLPKETLNSLSKYRSTGSRNKSSESLNPPRAFNDIKERDKSPRSPKQKTKQRKGKRSATAISGTENHSNNVNNL